MSNVLVFGVGHWDNEEHAKKQASDFNEWYTRVQAYLGQPPTFIACGTKSDPALCPLFDIDIAQINLTKSRRYSRDWSYYRVGFLTGLWHALLRNNWDILIHCQVRTLLGEDQTSKIDEFRARDEVLCAPSWRSVAGEFIETGFMMMKREAVLRYVTRPLRPCLSDNEAINVELEALNLFTYDWWNAWPEIISTRKRDFNYPNPNGLTVNMQNFLKLPMIAINRHCSEEEKKEWLMQHPVKKYLQFDG